jgi:LAGLIDADG endonuclease
MDAEQQAYLAGLIDGDGSIKLQLKPRTDVKHLFRVMVSVSIYQDSKYRHILEKLREWVGFGSICDYKNGMSEFRVEGFERVSSFLKEIEQYVLLKKEQVNIVLQAAHLVLSRENSVENFLTVCELADKVSSCNYKSRRKHSLKSVVAALEEAKRI